MSNSESSSSSSLDGAGASNITSLPSFSLPGTSAAPLDATLTTPWRCYNQLCSSGQTWYDRKTAGRKVCSQFFGRNKRETRRIDDDVWHWSCRKDYQRGFYRVKQGIEADDERNLARFQLRYIREQLLRLRLWRPMATFTLQLEVGAKKRLATFHETVRRNGGDNAAACLEMRVEPKQKKKQKEGSDIQYLPLAARDAIDFDHAEHIDGVLAGANKTYADLNAALNWIEQHIEAGTMLLMPPVEILISEAAPTETIRDPANNYDRWVAVEKEGKRVRQQQGLLTQQHLQSQQQLEQQQQQFRLLFPPSADLSPSSPSSDAVSASLSSSTSTSATRKPRVVKINGPRGLPPAPTTPTRKRKRDEAALSPSPLTISDQSGVSSSSSPKPFPTPAIKKLRLIARPPIPKLSLKRRPRVSVSPLTAPTPTPAPPRATAQLTRAEADSQADVEAVRRLFLIGAEADKVPFAPTPRRALSLPPPSPSPLSDSVEPDDDDDDDEVDDAEALANLRAAQNLFSIGADADKVSFNPRPNPALAPPPFPPPSGLASLDRTPRRDISHLMPDRPNNAFSGDPRFNASEAELAAAARRMRARSAAWAALPMPRFKRIPHPSSEPASSSFPPSSPSSITTGRKRKADESDDGEGAESEVKRSRLS